MATKTSKFEIENVSSGDLAMLYVRRWWCFREITAAVVAVFAICVASASAVGNGSGFFLPLIPIGLALALPSVQQELAIWRANGEHRAFHHFMHLDWPRLCIELGWTTGGGDHMYVPDLIHLERNREGETTMILRPLATQKPQHWSVMAEQLARTMGAPVHRWEEVEPGVIAIHGVTKDLPKHVDFDRRHHGGQAWDEVPLGIGVGEDRVVWRPSEVPHLLVAGSTGGGKGSVIRVAMHHALSAGWQVVGVNPRVSGEFGWAKRIGVPVVTDIENTLKMLAGSFRELQRRQVVLEAAGVSSWAKLPRDQTFPPLLIAIDEGATLLTPNKANKEMAKQQIQIGDYLARIAATGRAVGFHLVIATQRPDANNLGPAGGQLRNNIEARIAVGALDPDGLRMMFTTADPDVIGGLKGIKGRALASKLSTGDMDVRPLQVLYLDEADLMDNPPRVAIPQLLMQHLTSEAA